MGILDAARKGLSREVETALLKGADIEARDKEGRTPLLLAAQYGRTANVRLLLAKGANPNARDTQGWSAYMLALLAPSGGMVHTTHTGVLKLLPQPQHFRLAVTARWAPAKALFSSCFLRPEEMTSHMREIHPDGIVIDALRSYAASHHDFLSIVSVDARGNSEVSERPTPADVDAILDLLVEPGAACMEHPAAPGSAGPQPAVQQAAVQQVDELSMLIHATVYRPGRETPLYEKNFSYGLKTGMREQVAGNPNQYAPLYGSWAKAQAGNLYWAALTGLLLP